MVRAAQRRTSALTPVSHAATARQRAVARTLLQWYEEHRRALPWRNQPSPYATWISEVMLQQTQVAAAVPYFERWMRQFPSLLTLADASADAVLSAWQGLGYYSRARNLHQSAQAIRDVHGGQIPSDPDVLRKLPGIGRYTAGAIASIAYDIPEPAVDGNVMRVLTRLEALRGDPRAEPLASRLWQLAAALVQCASPSRFNQALMELGALVCVPKNPRCSQCPWMSLCQARKLDLIEQLPELPKRAPAEQRSVVVLVAKKRDSWMLIRQPPTARHWANLDVFPHAECTAGQSPLRAAEQLLASLDEGASIDTEPLTSFTYPITRFRFSATAYDVSGLRVKPLSRLGGRYVAAPDLAALAMPAPHRRLCQWLLRLADKAKRSPV